MGEKENQLQDVVLELSLRDLDLFADWCMERYPDNPFVAAIRESYDDENDLFLGGDPELRNEDAHQCGSRVGSALLKECPELFNEFLIKKQKVLGEVEEANLPPKLRLELRQLEEEAKMEEQRRQWEWSS